MEELNEYLFQVVQNARKCNHCALRHDDGICFFAYECIKYDFHYYKEKDDNMSDFEKMCRIITKFPRKNEYNEECYEIRKFDKDGAHAIYFATSDSYCWAGLYFDKDGNFVGFSPEWDEE